MLISSTPWAGARNSITAWTTSSGAEAPAPIARQAVPPVAVAITASRAESVTRVFSAEGQALPDRDTALRAEAAGTIAEVLVRRGQDVEADAVVARIDGTRLQSELARAEAELREAERDLANAERLASQGVVSANEREQSRLARAGAAAQLAAAREALDDSTIRAPFAGRVESFDLDPGEYVQAGAEVGRLVDNQPLLVSVAVPQQALTRIANGQTATVSFITGEEREGTVTFVGTAASAATQNAARDLLHCQAASGRTGETPARRPLGTAPAPSTRRR